MFYANNWGGNATLQAGIAPTAAIVQKGRCVTPTNRNAASALPACVAPTMDVVAPASALQTRFAPPKAHAVSKNATGKPAATMAAKGKGTVASALYAARLAWMATVSLRRAWTGHAAQIQKDAAKSVERARRRTPPAMSPQVNAIALCFRNAAKSVAGRARFAWTAFAANPLAKARRDVRTTDVVAPALAHQDRSARHRISAVPLIVRALLVDMKRNAAASVASAKTASPVSMASASASPIAWARIAVMTAATAVAVTAPGCKMSVPTAFAYASPSV